MSGPDIDRNNLSFWFPKIEAAGLPVPRTKLFTMPLDAQMDLWASFDGKEGDGSFKAWAETVKPIADEIGYPLFLRSGHTSGKHEWEKTCFVESEAELQAHIGQIAYFSECVSFMGELPWETWAVREMLPTIPVGICRRYGNMPICREFRFFVENDEVQCWHPYWPHHALDQGGAQFNDGDKFDYEAFCTPADIRHLCDLARAAGRAVGGAWSVDLLETKRGWFVTDMAVAADSYHWEDCPNIPQQPTRINP